MIRKGIRSSFYFLIGLLVFGLTWSACKKLDNFEDYNITNVDAEFGIPLFKTGFSMQDLLVDFDERASLTFGTDGIITLQYTGEPVVRTSNELFEVLSLVNNVPIPVLDTFTTLPFQAPNGVEIDSASLKTGGIQFGFSSDHPEDVSVTLIIPSLQKDGVPFQHTINASYFGSVPVFGAVLSPIDLAGYELKVEDGLVFLRYEAIRQNGIADTLANFFVIFSDLTASYVEGYLGTTVYELDRDTLAIDLLETLNQGEIQFVDPRIHLTVDNSFGFPARSQTEVLNIFTRDDGVKQIESSLISDGIDFAYPTLDEVGDLKRTRVSFDNSNSNIVSVVNAGPIAVDYKIDVLTNPDMQTEIRGFLTDTSELRAVLEVELPIYGSLAGLTASDTLRVDTFDFNIDLSEYGDPDYAEFKLVSENSIPLDIDLQLYFATELGIIVDSLYASPQRLVRAAEVDEDGFVTSSTRTETFSRMEYNRFQSLTKTKMLLMRTSFSSAENGTRNVRLLSDQKVDLGMGLKFGVNR
ncbi:MAG: hypothetical protein AAF985_09125 [Bacteroidota bacterium]